MTNSERRLAAVCEWSGGMVRYHLQPGTFGILLLVARGPGDKVRVVPLSRTDGSAADWRSMSARDRTARAEQLFHDEAQVIHRES